MKPKTKKAIMLIILKKLELNQLVCSKDFKIDEENEGEEFISICIDMMEKRYIEGFYPMDATRGDDPDVLKNVEITVDGEEFLEQNSKIRKVFNLIEKGAQPLSELVSLAVSLL